MGAKLSNQDSTILWTSEEIANAVKGQCGADFNITGVQIDSRAIEPGDLFIAIKAERDGHDFAKSALNHGAGGVLISDNEVIGSSQNYVLCDDTMLALESLGAAARRRGKQAAKIAFRRARRRHRRLALQPRQRRPERRGQARQRQANRQIRPRSRGK